MAGNKHYF